MGRWGGWKMWDLYWSNSVVQHEFTTELPRGSGSLLPCYCLSHKAIIFMPEAVHKCVESIFYYIKKTFWNILIATLFTTSITTKSPGLLCILLAQRYAQLSVMNTPYITKGICHSGSGEHLCVVLMFEKKKDNFFAWGRTLGSLLDLMVELLYILVKKTSWGESWSNLE